MNRIIRSCWWDNDVGTEQSTKPPKNTNEQQSILGGPGKETSGVAGNRVLLRLRNVTATRQLKADHSLTDKPTKPKYTAEYAEVKHRRAWAKEQIRKVTWCYMYYRQNFTENYKKMYEIRRQRNPECRMYMDAKKLMNQKIYCG